MTNYENRRKEVLQAWANLQLEKDAKIRELWTINYKLEKLENLLKKYGIAENHGLLKESTELG